MATEEIKPDNGKPDDATKSGGQEIPPKLSEPPKDFKLCEIWVRNGMIQLDAIEIFWSDRHRAVGIFEECKDIMKSQKPQEKKPNIITGIGMEAMDYIRNRVNKFRRK